MHWNNSDAAVRTSLGLDNTESVQLIDDAGAVVKQITQAADGTVTETTRKTTPAVARVVVGTIDTALSGTPALLTFGGLSITTVASGPGIPDDDDGTVLFPYLEANKALIPAESVVDNEDLTFTITFKAGATPNDYILASADAALTFEETVEGADVIHELTDLVAERYALPATLPEVPATPNAQDIVDALIELGLVTQAEA